MNMIPTAVDEFLKAIKADETMDESRLNVGSIYLDYLDYKSSQEQFDKVLARFPKHYTAMVGSADSLYGLSEYEKAVALYEASLEIRDDNPEALIRLGKLYEEQLGKPKKALSYYIRYRDVSKPPPSDPIHQNIQFLQQMSKAKPPPAVKEESVPAKEELAPPAEGEAVPAEEEVIPAKGEAVPAEGEATPVQKEDPPKETPKEVKDSEASAAQG